MIKQISSISSIQNVSSKFSWINNLLNSHKVSSNSLFKNKDYNESPRSIIENRQVLKIKKNLFALSSDNFSPRIENPQVIKVKENLLALSSDNSFNILHLSENHFNNDSKLD